MTWFLGMLGIIIVVLVLAGMFARSMTPQERLEFLHRVRVFSERARQWLEQGPPGCEAFFEVLRQRTQRVVAMPVVVGVNVAIFAAMCFSAGALSEPATLIGWGGNFGPRTTNGEWWRLVTAMFVHSGTLSLIANVAGLFVVGLILERLVGPVAFATTYLASGVVAGLADLSAHQATANVGAAGAIFGIYGLTLAWLTWSLYERSIVTIPFAALKVLAPGAALFLLYGLATPALQGYGRFAGFAAGFVVGLLLTAGVREAKPETRRIAGAVVATLAVALIWAAPLRGLADVTPEIGQVIAVENRTAQAYDAALDRFNDGRSTLKERIELIDRIRPELQGLRARLESLHKVPREHQRLVATAVEYLKLRDESWRMRGAALRKGSMGMLRDADAVERDSLVLWHSL